MKSLKTLSVLFTMFSLLFLFSACSEEDDATPDPADATLQIELANDSNLGSYLVNQDGRAFYFFSRDVDGTSACEGGCLDTWPAYYQADFEVGSGLDQSDFGTITRADGEMQTTYKGWPLYYYSGDTGANQINGEGIGQVWFVAKPDYTLMLATQVVEAVGSDPISYLVDAEGNSLYYFENDENNVSVCTDGCLDAWPAFNEVANVVLPSTLNQGAFAAIDRTDGGQQLTYAGRPIYFFAQDAQRGDTNGAAVPAWTISQLPG
ncbi:hypothetical protein [Tunicatimonas pelagia]|uniref:hypothetical protein n=1 Tax=Tunicatimonas pelagia TaxID=931531 RepID=UPI0026660241|nr:hypothetical protein [Tunicatimonas pelagia]WKN43848.1 hypothetical protein P0M28_02540 [Tunicatimonas pelagia]